jgi:outer membrane protein TolC
VDWDFGLTLTLPIFEGGVTQSHVREASSQLRQADLQLSLLRQQVADQVRQLFEDLNSSVKQVTVLDKGNQSAERNYREELREYRLGLTNNLDVNTAQANYIVTSSSLEQARYNTRVIWAKLQSATGETLR